MEDLGIDSAPATHRLEVVSKAALKSNPGQFKFGIAQSLSHHANLDGRQRLPEQRVIAEAMGASISRGSKLRNGVLVPHISGIGRR